MADLIFNIARGREAYYASLPAANDALVMVPLESSGLVADSTMRDYDDLAAVLAGATNEQTTMGRKTLASVTVTVNDTDDRVELDCADVTWTAPTGNAVAALLICYDPDTTGGTDSSIVPLFKFDWSFTPAGVDQTATITSGGFFWA